MTRPLATANLSGYTTDSGLLVADRAEANRRSLKQIGRVLSNERKGMKARPGLLQLRQKERILLLPDGTRVKHTLEESGHVTHIEHDDRIDCIVYPTTYRTKLPMPPGMTYD